MACVSLPSVDESRLKMSAKELSSSATPRISSLVSSDKPPPSSNVGALLVRVFGEGLALVPPPPLRKDGRKRPSPAFDAPPPDPLDVEEAPVRPDCPKGDVPLEPELPGRELPTVGFVPVERVLPYGDDVLEPKLLELLDGAAGFLSPPPPKRPVRPPNKPPAFPPLAALGCAGLSLAAPPPPKRPVIPPNIPPGFAPPGALGCAGLSLAAPPPPKRPLRPPKRPPDFLSSDFAGALVGLGAFELPPNDPLELLPLEPVLLPPKDEPLLLAGRLVGDELLEPDDGGLLLAGRLPLPKGDDPLELLGLLELPKEEPPLLAGRLPLPNELPEPLPGELGVLLAGRLPPLLNGELPPLDVEGPEGEEGRAPVFPVPNGRAPDDELPPGGGLVRAPAPGKPVVGRFPKVLVELLEPPNGFTRD